MSLVSKIKDIVSGGGGAAALNPASVAGTIGLGAAFGGAELYGAHMSNEANAKQAELNRRFQRQMSSTAYQRAVKDMRAAGLNPLLAGVNSSPASTPGGSMARMENIAKGATSTALQARRLGQEIQNMKATEDQSRATAHDTRASAIQRNYDTSLKAQQLKESVAREQESRQRKRNLRYDGVKKSVEADVYARGGEALGWLEKTLPGILGAAALRKRWGRSTPGSGIKKPNTKAPRTPYSKMTPKQRKRYQRKNGFKPVR